MTPTFSRNFLASAVGLILTIAPLVADPAGKGAGGAATRSTARSNVNNGSVNRNRNNVSNRDINNNTNISNNTNINRNTNINVDRDVNINVDHHYGCCYYGSTGSAVALASAVTATAMVTAAVIGSTVNTLPPSCTVVITNGLTYQHCGTTWYQPQFVSGTTTYVVVHAP
jgi:hypothetical protein